MTKEIRPGPAGVSDARAGFEHLHGGAEVHALECLPRRHDDPSGRLPAGWGRLSVRTWHDLTDDVIPRRQVLEFVVAGGVRCRGRLSRV